MGENLDDEDEWTDGYAERSFYSSTDEDEMENELLEKTMSEVDRQWVSEEDDRREQGLKARSGDQKFAWYMNQLMHQLDAFYGSIIQLADKVKAKGYYKKDARAEAGLFREVQQFEERLRPYVSGVIDNDFTLGSHD